MHLGRFHYVIESLVSHFREAQLPEKLEQCASLLDQYNSSKSSQQLEAFRSAVQELLSAAGPNKPELSQPYARQVIAELEIDELLPPLFQSTVKRRINDKSFDPNGLANSLRELGTSIKKRIAHIIAIDSGFSALGVEYERVDSASAEIGFLIPREVVGDSLKNLIDEFGDLSKLVRAINELVGAKDYDPQVLTISSSWWQIFLNLDPEQILIWVLAIERIVNLFKSNLEIKTLQQQLNEKNIPKKITDLIDKEIQERVTKEIRSLASEICKDYAKTDDKARLNEIETQLRQGLIYLAKRMNQGAHVEINVGIPEEPDQQEGDDNGEQRDENFQKNLSDARERIAQLRMLRDRALAASSETTAIGTDAPLLLGQDSPPAPDVKA